jgi:PelA/Pel-15E family pectate lyase
MKLFLFLAALFCALPLRADVRDYLKKPAAWYSSDEAKTIAANVLSQQAPLGDWPKNGDTAQPYKGDRQKIEGTFDNGATVNEMRFLAKMFNAATDAEGRAKYRAAFINALDHIIAAQYPSGGWPQSFPSGTGYPRHITFNDGTMVNLLLLLREVAEKNDYAFVDEQRRAKAQAAFDKGIECILKCQIMVNGKRTVWCAQHDEITFEPRAARAYELPSFSGSESVGIVRLLMSLDKPSPAVIAAVQSAIEWLKSAQITGIRLERREDKAAPKGYDTLVVADAAAPPLWARFYDLQTQKPFFCSRDGVPRASLAEISYERRNGYAWYGNWPAKLIAEEYPTWQKKWAPTHE